MNHVAELIIRNAMVYDGGGAPPFPGDVAVTDGRILAVGKRGISDSIHAETIVDAGGRALAPGFIDAHTHDDRAVIDDAGMLAKISQGVTTVVTGNCGISLAPVSFADRPPPPMNLLGNAEAYSFPTMASYQQRIRRAPPAVNVVALVGHSALRLRVMDRVDRPATADETLAMRDILRQSMDEGASGFSTGLYYPPNEAATRQEVAQIAGAAADSGGIYTTHMRDEGAHIIDSIDESVGTASDAGVPLLISHLKCAGMNNWKRSREVLERLASHENGSSVHFDVYPYHAGSTVLRADETGEEVRIIITWSEPHPELGGRNLADIAEMWGVSILKAVERLQPAGAIYFQMHEDDVQKILSSGHSIIGSDGIPGDQHPHPRLWGTFPRVLGRYARELALFTLETAIHKMTGKTADVFGLADRGRIKAGNAADLVLFNAATIIDNATFEDPKKASTGIDGVWVNGQLAYHDMKAVAPGAGLLLRSSLH